MHEGASRAPDVKTAADLQRLGLSFQSSRTFLTAYELGVFTAIGDGGPSPSEIAERVGADRFAVERLAHALCALGLLEKREGRFFNAPVAGRYLVRGKPDYLAMTYADHQWDNWSLLTEAVRRGQPTVVKPFHDPLRVWVGALRARFGKGLSRVWGVISRSDRWMRAFIGFMRDHARLNAEAVAGLLDLSAAARVLDVGGGPGIYAIAFARANPQLRVTVFDRPEMVSTALGNAAEAGLSDRIDAVAGDFLSDDLGEGFDVVFISYTAHGYSDGDNEALVRKAFRALNPGGRIVVHDYTLTDDRTGPLPAAMFSLEMLMSTTGGNVYSRQEVSRWISAAGFASIEISETGLGSMLVIGHKAAV